MHRRHGFNEFLHQEYSLEGGNSNPLPLLPGKSHEQRNLEGYNPWGRRESDMTERLTTQSIMYETALQTHTSRSICYVGQNNHRNMLLILALCQAFRLQITHISAAKIAILQP